MRWWPLTREEALALAREHVERQDLPWADPISILRRPLGGWSIVTNSDHRGGNIFIEISRRGNVKGGAGVTPR